MEYRGIQLDESVKLYSKNGEYNKTVKKSLDKLADLLAEKSHVLMSEYVKNHDKVLIDFRCEHEPHLITPNDYKHGYGCPKCGRKKTDLANEKKKEKAKHDLLKLLKENGHILLSEYKGNHKKVTIDFKCDHEPHSLTPAHYKGGQGCPKCADIRTGEFHFNEGKKRFFSLLESNGHTLVGEYKGGHTKVLINFNCEHEPHSVTPALYTQGIRCPKCSGHCPEQAKENFYLEVKKAEYKIIGEYVNTAIKVELQCDKGHLFSMRPNSFVLHGQRCPKCQNRCPEQAKTNFYLEVKKAGYKLLGTYKGTHIKVELQCDKGHFWTVKPNSFMSQGTRCVTCSGLDPEQAKKDFLKELEENGHVLLSEYGKNASEKVLIDFKCKHKPSWTSPHSYRMSKCKCLECSYEATSKKRSQETREAFPLLVQSNGHILLTEYGINCYEKVLIDFKCKHKPHWIAPTSYKSGQGCPICSESKGEKIIREWLEKNQIEYISQYKLPNKRWLYDFYIPSENLIIEVQGKQHFQFVEYFHKTKENFYKQANDYNDKWAYARLKLGINYIEVDYRESKPELALERFLKEYNELKRPNILNTGQTLQAK